MSTINKLGQYTGVEVSVQKQATTDEEVEAQVQALVAQNPKMIEKDGEVENGDITTIDFEGFKDGVAFDGGKAEGHVLEIGSKQFIPGFEDQMIGMKKGEERELNLTFPENYASKELAGAAVVFKVMVHKIEQREAAELNDEFVASLHMPEITTVDDLYKEMRAFIESSREQEYEYNLGQMAFEKIVEASDVEVSDEEVDATTEEQIGLIRMELGSQGVQLEQYLEMMNLTIDQLRQQIRPTAEKQAKLVAILDAIAAAEKFEVSEEEVTSKIALIAAQNGVSPDMVEAQTDREVLRVDMNRSKAYEHVTKNVKLA